MPNPPTVDTGTGLYAPDSVTWRIASDNALMLGGGRALLLQLAHPLVAAGVAAHSDFLSSPVARLERTMTLTLRMVFGTLAQAHEAARAVNRTHERVQGVSADGTSYRASDASLLLWVHATLVDSALETYATFVRPLSEADRDTYYRESWVLGRLLGIPPAAFPPDYPAFQTYVRETASGLAVSDEARRLASAVLRPPLRGVPRPVFWPHEVITAGLLPAPVREQYGLAWPARREAAYRALVVAFRGAVRAAPPFLRRAAPARAAERRLGHVR